MPIKKRLDCYLIPSMRKMILDCWLIDIHLSGQVFMLVPFNWGLCILDPFTFQKLQHTNIMDICCLNCHIVLASMVIYPFFNTKSILEKGEQVDFWMREWSLPHVLNQTKNDLIWINAPYRCTLTWLQTLISQFNIQLKS